MISLVGVQPKKNLYNATVTNPPNNQTTTPDPTRCNLENTHAGLKRPDLTSSLA